MQKIQSVTIGEFNTFKSWGMYINGSVVVGAAEPKYNYIEVPGMDGVLDATETLEGLVHYNARNIKIPIYKICRNKEEMRSLYSEIQNSINGRRNKIILSDDSRFYWEGRLSVSDPEYNGRIFSTEIEGTVGPYKICIDPIISDDWEWDTFDFENDVINEITNVSISALQKYVYVYGDSMPYVPEIKVESPSNMILIYEGKSYTLQPGVSRILSVVIRKGLNTLEFIGDGIVTISYIGGRL